MRYVAEPGTGGLDIKVREAQNLSELDRAQHNCPQHVHFSRMLEHAEVLARALQGLHQERWLQASGFAQGDWYRTVPRRVAGDEALDCSHGVMLAEFSSDAYDRMAGLPTLSSSYDVGFAVR